MHRCVIVLISIVVAASPVRAQAVSGDEAVYGDMAYSLYPAVLSDKPNLPSPMTAAAGAEYVAGLTEDGRYTISPITMDKGDELNYAKRIWYAMGRQRDVDSVDFPALDVTGLHSERELSNTRTTTGRPVEEITRIGRPEQ